MDRSRNTPRRQLRILLGVMCASLDSDRGNASGRANVTNRGRTARSRPRQARVNDVPRSRDDVPRPSVSGCHDAHRRSAARRLGRRSESVHRRTRRVAGFDGHLRFQWKIRRPRLTLAGRKVDVGCDRLDRRHAGVDGSQGVDDLVRVDSPILETPNDHVLDR